jgi:argininosuccinate lyase
LLLVFRIMAKLWDKGIDSHSLIEAFTVGDDYLLDARLTNADCAAGMAHAVMLGSIGLLKKAEVESLKRGLAAIVAENDAGEFHILRSDEDVHTAIENRLTALIGEPGKKIHSGRSRNDQSAAAIRLWMKGFLFSFQRACISLIRTLLDFAEAHADTPMPGRTHTQTAMPSSVGLWAAAYAEELTDDLTLAHDAFRIIDCCPLGSAASYGVPVPLDREMTADLLGFARVQNNVLYAGNSRGKFESIVLGAVEQTALTLSKAAQDLILFSLPEFGYFTLPPELCTGSSIMPQKKNPDGLEAIRAASAVISADRSGIASVVRALPSGYNRDFQYTKGPFFRSCESGLACVRVMDLTVSSLIVNIEALRSAFTPEIFAADRALELVAEGMPFRDAYKKVGGELGKLKGSDPVEAIRKKTSTGAPGNLRLDVSRAAVKDIQSRIETEESQTRARISSLAGREVEIFRDIDTATQKRK